MTAVGTSVGRAAGASVVGPMIWLIPETVASPVGAPRLPPPRGGNPQDSRRRFLAAVPTLMASLSITGLFLALTPSVVTGVLHVAQGAAGGLEIAALFLADRGIGRGGTSNEALSSRSPSSGPLPWRGRHMRGIVAVCPLMVLRAPQLQSELCNRVTFWR